GNTVLAEGWEVRFIGEPHPDDAERLRALPIPDWFRALFDDAGDSARLHLLDSITAIDEQCADGVIVSGSHGGLSSTGFVLRAPIRPRAVFFNDAGVGRDGAGIVALALLDEIGVPCGCYAHDSARIGEARDGYERGVVTHLNARARATGLAAGISVRDAVALLGGLDG